MTNTIFNKEKSDIALGLFFSLCFGLNSKKLIDFINYNNSIPWSAKYYPSISQIFRSKPSSLSIEQNKHLNKLIQKSKKTLSFPSYNFFDEYPFCRTPPFFQGNTTMCFAIATSTVLSHRICRKTGKNVQLNPQPIFGCDIFSNGIKGGGKEQFAYRFMQTKGIPSTSCFKFSLSSKCNASFMNCELYKAQYKSEKTLIGEEEIIEEILKNGPVTATISLMNDFAHYSNGIYKTSNFFANNLNEYHNIEIFGWGQENGIPFWLIQNSFGKDWGINGTAKILRGENHIGIESYATAVLPQ